MNNSDKPDVDPVAKESVSNCSSEADAADGEFEPTAEMLVNDFDDERTLEEEEAMECGENAEEEVDNLNKERDMPIEELLAIYGAFPPQPPAEEEEMEQDDEEIDHEDEDEEDEAETNCETPEPSEINDNDRLPEAEDQEVSRSTASDENSNNAEKMQDGKLLPIKSEKRKKEKSELSQLYPEIEANGDGSGSASLRSLRSGSRPASEDEDDDMEDDDEEEATKKQIMIGSIFQAVVPEGLSPYGDTPPYENEDKLLWEPDQVEPSQTELFLKDIGQPPPGAHGICGLPMGNHIRDNEQALHLLLQCGYNIDEALRRFNMNPAKVASAITLWSEEECRNFENGLKSYGKDFHMIQQNKVKTRSVGELVQFYYLWKKTERHDMFANKTRIEKKKYIVHPGTTDYMDRFLDEGETIYSGSSLTQPRVDSRSSSPGTIHSLLYGDCLKGVPAPIPPSTVTSASVSVITAESAAAAISSQVDSEYHQRQGEFLRPYAREDSDRVAPHNAADIHTRHLFNTNPRATPHGIKRSISPNRDVQHKLMKKSPAQIDPAQINKAEAMAS